LVTEGGKQPIKCPFPDVVSKGKKIGLRGRGDGAGGKNEFSVTSRLLFQRKRPPQSGPELNNNGGNEKTKGLSRGDGDRLNTCKRKEAHTATRERRPDATLLLS